MAKYLLIILIVVCAGCSRKTVYVPVESHSETRYIHTERIDTVYADLPKQSALNTTLDSVSHLETDLAESVARINADGSLSHSLTNKPGKVAVPVTVPTDTVFKDNYVEVPYEVKVPVEVERKLNTWEKFRLRAFWPLVVCVAAIIGWRFLKRRYLIK